MSICTIFPSKMLFNLMSLCSCLDFAVICLNWSYFMFYIFVFYLLLICTRATKEHCVISVYVVCYEHTYTTMKSLRTEPSIGELFLTKRPLHLQVCCSFPDIPGPHLRNSACYYNTASISPQCVRHIAETTLGIL